MIGDNGMGFAFLFARYSGVFGVAWVSAFFSHEATVSFTLSVVGMIMLCVYERARKHKNTPPVAFWDWLDRNFVRLIFAAIIAPHSINALIEVVKAGGAG